jgi:hypothetical protein
MPFEHAGRCGRPAQVGPGPQGPRESEVSFRGGPAGLDEFVAQALVLLGTVD